MVDIVFFEIGSKPLADIGVLPRKPSDIDLFGPVECVEPLLQKMFTGRVMLHSKTPSKVVYRCSNALSNGHVMVEVEDSCASQNSIDIYHEMLTELCGVPEPAVKAVHEGQNIAVVPAHIDWLLFFKESHKFKKDSVHFLKTLNDIRLLYDIGAYMPVGFTNPLFKERERLTYTNKLPNLNVKKDTFFDPNTVPYKYDHDSIHRAVAIFDKPAYLYYKPDDKDVYCSQEMFESCDMEIRLAGVVEESMVLALERSLVPFGFKPNPDRAFSMALEKVCTSITSGFFREFAYRHYHEAQKMYRQIGGSIYVRHFQKALESGMILPFNQSTHYQQPKEAA